MSLPKTKAVRLLGSIALSFLLISTSMALITWSMMKLNEIRATPESREKSVCTKSGGTGPAATFVGRVIIRDNFKSTDEFIEPQTSWVEGCRFTSRIVTKGRDKRYDAKFHYDPSDGTWRLDSLALVAPEADVIQNAGGG